MKMYELIPGRYDRVKSFYGKARVIEKDNGEKVFNIPGGGKSWWDSLKIHK